MHYCQQCVIPDTRPNIRLDASGVCNACRTHATKDEIDWFSRADAFRHVAEGARQRARSHDCVIPVSGGKDSIWQVVKCLEHDLVPLAVTWKTPGRTPLGQHNLDALVRLGVDHIDYTIDPGTESRFMYRALCEAGSTAVPMHMAIFSIPLTIAVLRSISLIVWGENSAFEYGSAEAQHEGMLLDDEWLRHYGVTHGTTAEDWLDESLTRKKMSAYFGPGARELQTHGIRAVFLGYYFRWDPEESLRVATEVGFRKSDERPRTGYWDYADVDCSHIAVHHYLKWYKFGFTRIFDNLSVDIRNGRITRDEAIERIREAGDQTPHRDIRSACEFMGISEQHFYEVIERFRNRDIWHFGGGAWRLPGFLIDDWDWK